MQAVKAIGSFSSTALVTQGADDVVVNTADDVANLRRSAVNKDWKQEQELVARTGKGTANWTDSKMDELLTTGHVKGFQGHHINSVKGSLQGVHDMSLISNPNNIQFLSRIEHLMQHFGNFRNITSGQLIDRLAMLVITV